MRCVCYNSLCSTCRLTMDPRVPVDNGNAINLSCAVYRSSTSSMDQSDSVTSFEDQILQDREALRNQVSRLQGKALASWSFRLCTYSWSLPAVEDPTDQKLLTLRNVYVSQLRQFATVNLRSEDPWGTATVLVISGAAFFFQLHEYTYSRALHSYPLKIKWARS